MRCQCKISRWCFSLVNYCDQVDYVSDSFRLQSPSGDLSRLAYPNSLTPSPSPFFRPPSQFEHVRLLVASAIGGSEERMVWPWTRQRGSEAASASTALGIDGDAEDDHGDRTCPISGGPRELEGAHDVGTHRSAAL